jgi:hypothetical protein
VLGNRTCGERVTAHDAVRRRTRSYLANRYRIFFEEDSHRRAINELVELDHHELQVEVLAKPRASGS